MSINKIISKFQSTFGMTKSELLFAFLIFFGILTGTIIKIVKWNGADKQNYVEIQRILDSLAEVSKSTYIGSDLSGNSFPELATGDTLVKKENLFPDKSKKDTLNEKINLNKASLAELTKLPGIGRKTAEKIIEFRKNNKFAKIQDLMKIPGIGEKKFDKIKPNVVVK